MSNKRDLKAYMRLDHQHRVIPTSLIFRKRMPKLGRWIEVGAYECCNATTTTTSTTVLCDNLVCNTIMTVGVMEGPVNDVYGYMEGEGGIGTLDPDCSDVVILIHYASIMILYSAECYDSPITIVVDGVSYELTYSGYNGSYVYASAIMENPFPGDGETCTIQICATECTVETTTTTEPVCSTYEAHGSIIARVALWYRDCDGEEHVVWIDGEEPYQFCATAYSIGTPGTVELVDEECIITTTTTTAEPTTTTTTTTVEPTTTTTTTTEAPTTTTTTTVQG